MTRQITDTERLDYLESNSAELQRNRATAYGDTGWLVHINGYVQSANKDHATAREAIDTAIGANMPRTEHEQHEIDTAEADAPEVPGWNA